jgi:hypothetical protein
MSNTLPSFVTSERSRIKFGVMEEGLCHWRLPLWVRDDIGSSYLLQVHLPLSGGVTAVKCLPLPKPV